MIIDLCAVALYLHLHAWAKRYKAQHSFCISNLQIVRRIIFVIYTRTAAFSISTCLKLRIQNMYAIYVIYPMLGIVASGIT